MWGGGGLSGGDVGKKIGDAGWGRCWGYSGMLKTLLRMLLVKYHDLVVNEDVDW